MSKKTTSAPRLADAKVSFDGIEFPVTITGIDYGKPETGEQSAPSLAGHWKYYMPRPTHAQRAQVSVGPTDVTLFSVRLKTVRLEDSDSSAFDPGNIYGRARCVYLRLIADVFERATGEPIEITNRVMVPACVDLGKVTFEEQQQFIRSPAFPRWLRGEIASLLMHELDENLWVGGKLWRDPHEHWSIVPLEPIDTPKQYPSPK